jgi:predicted Zn-dependent protease
MIGYPIRAREFANQAVELAREAGADQAEALAVVGLTAITRFANNHIHQNVTEDNTEISVRAVLGTRVGVASTNRVDDASLAACCAAAVRAATAAPADAGFPGLPAMAPAETPRRAEHSTHDFDAAKRAAAVRSIVDQSATRDLVAAGTVGVTEHSIAVANSLEIDVSQTVNGLRATVLSMSPGGGSGWASFVSRDADELAPAALGDEAATLAERSDGAGTLDPGSYTVVLAPEAVSDLLDFIGWLSFSAKSVEEGRSFMSGRIGQKVMHESITIVDDALGPHSMGLTFDYEGVRKTLVTLVEDGVAIRPVTDSYWAARTNTPNTGHALPAPNSYGPLPVNLEILGGDATIDDLIGSVDRGVYVTRFHYVNVEDPIPVTLTGMTRDGTFLIENGHLTRPLKNLRFTQSAIEALSDVRGITHDRAFIGTETSPTYVPGLLLGSFAFTGQTG